jgi:PAS domain S-box-containing protein
MSLADQTLSSSILRHIMDHARDAIMVVDADSLTVLDVNQNACQMLGYAHDELIGQPLSNIECSLQDVFFWEDVKQMPHFDGSRVAEGEWLGKNGDAFPVEKRVSSYTENGIRYWIIHVEDITHRREIAEEQIQLVAQLQSSLEATAEGILEVDLSGQVINLNRRFASMWGVPDEVLAARRVDGMLAYIKSCLQSDVGLSASLKQLEHEPDQDTEDLLALRDGRYYVCVSKPEFLRDRRVGRVFSVRDITAMKQAEKELVSARDAAEQASQEKSSMLDALQVSESRLRRLVNSSLIGIMQGDMTGRLTDANDVLLQIVGMSRGDIGCGEVYWQKIASSSSHAAYHHAMQEIREHGQAHPFEGELIRSDGARIPVMVGLAKLEGSNEEWVGFVLDLTEQRKADRIKSEFVAVVSHELRTPLTSIRGALGLLESGVAGELPPKAQQLIQLANKNGQRLGALVNDILDMEKLSSGKMSFNIVKLDLVAQTRQALDVNASYAQTLGVSFQLTQHPEQAWVNGDSDRIMQVFSNLLSNAAKHSPKGDKVEIRVLAQADRVRVEVEDHGPGIAESFRDQIFKKFAQADGGNTRQQGGTGLGLNITKTFVEKMGGEIGFESEEGKGTVFWFTLPLSVEGRGE